MQKRFKVAELYVLALMVKAYNKITNADSGRRDNTKFRDIIKTAITKRETEIEMQKKMDAERKAKEEDETKAKAAASRRSWGF